MNLKEITKRVEDTVVEENLVDFFKHSPFYSADIELERAKEDPSESNRAKKNDVNFSG